MADHNTLLAKYVELKRTVRKLEAEIESLNDAIYSQVEQAGGKLTGGDYAISSRRRENYVFSDNHHRKQTEIRGLREHLKQLEQREIDAGVAQVESYTNIVTVRFDD